MIFNATMNVIRTVNGISCRKLFVGTFVALLLLTPFSNAESIEIQKVTSPGGIEAWFVENRSLPLVSMRFGFSGAGASQDPEGKEGLANLMSGLLDEGAGEMTSEQFREQLEDLSIELSFWAGRDNFGGVLEMLSVYKEEAFNLMELAMNQPRFDEKPFNRIRTQIEISVEQSKTDPESLAWDTMSKVLFDEHPYANPVDGTLESLASITPQDLRDAHKRLFGRDNLKIAVVGDISAKELGKYLDQVFLSLPESSELIELADIEAPSGRIENVFLDVPQTVIRFALPGILRNDPDFFPAFVMLHIFGSGSFTSWLYQEVREKNGLAYSVSANLYYNDHNGLIVGGAETRTENTEEVIKLVKQQIEKMATEGPSQDEIDSAQKYLTGSYALRFDTSGKIARQMLGLQLAGFGSDYIDTRNGKINAVTIDEVRKVAKRLLSDIEPSIVTIGRNSG